MLAALLAVTSGLAAGTTVDLIMRGEARTSFLSEPVADGFSNQLTAGGFTPTLRAAHQGQFLFLDANYAPNINFIYPSADYFLVMHRFGGQMSFAPTQRLRFTADLTGAIGDLDAGAAVRDLGNSRAAALVGGGNLTQFPFGDVSGGVNVGYRVDPRLTFNASVRNSVTGSPSPGEDEQILLPFQVRPEATTGLTYLITPTDSVSGDLQLRGAIIADERGVLGNGGGYVSLTPTIAYNRSLFPGVVGSVRGGWLSAIVDEGKRRDRLAHGLPVVDASVRASVNLSGEGAIEGALVGGITPSSDPLGGLLEERIGAGVQGAWRVNRDLSFNTSVSSFGTLYAVGGNAQIAQESSTAVGGSVGFAYNLGEWIAINGEVLGSTRLLSDKFGRLVELRPDVTVGIGITGALNLFRFGERPPGTDPRPGRAVATRPVSLPGSAKAFSGKDVKKKKKGRTADLDKVTDKKILEEILDKRRRGISVDEDKLIKQRLAEKKKKGTKQEVLSPLEAFKKREAELAAKAAAAEAEAEAARKKKKEKEKAEADAAAAKKKKK